MADQPSSAPTYKEIKYLYTKLCDTPAEEARAEVRRDFRKHEIDVETLRKDGKLTKWQTAVPQRIIDNAITLDVTSYTKPLMEAKSLVSLIDMAEPKNNANHISEFFTTLVRFGDWLQQWVDTADSLSEQGGVCMEVKVNEDAPAFSKFEFFPREHLRIPAELKKIEDTDIIGRRIPMTKTRLKAITDDMKFKPEAIKKLYGDEATFLEDNRPYETVFIDKVYFRKNGRIYQCFCHPSCDEFLRTDDPVPLDKLYKEPTKSPDGTLDWKSPTRFPIHVGSYRAVSQRCLFEQKGRAYQDAPAQEAATQMWSGAVNATIRSSFCYASLADQAGEADFTETAPIEPDSIVKAKINFSYPPAPDADLIGAIRAFTEEHRRTTGQFDVAALNKKYQSAREIQMASSLSSAFALNQSLPWAMFVREVMTTAWHIFQHFANLSATTDDGQVNYEISPLPYNNLLPQILRYYEVMDGGVAKMLKEQEDAKNIMMILSQMPNNPYALPMTQTLNSILFPAYAEDWNLIKVQIDQLVGTLNQLGNLLLGQFVEEAKKPEEERTMSPQDLMNLQQILNQINATIAPYGFQLGSQPNTSVGQAG